MDHCVHGGVDNYTRRVWDAVGPKDGGVYSHRTIQQYLHESKENQLLMLDTLLEIALFNESFEEIRSRIKRLPPPFPPETKTFHLCLANALERRIQKNVLEKIEWVENFKTHISPVKKRTAPC